MLVMLTALAAKRPDLSGAAAIADAVLWGREMPASALSAALSYGPEHAWAWLDLTVQAGLGRAVRLCLLLLPARRRGAAALGWLAVGVQLARLNKEPATAQFSEKRQNWAQGRSIRCEGTGQGVGGGRPMDRGPGGRQVVGVDRQACPSGEHRACLGPGFAGSLQIRSLAAAEGTQNVDGPSVQAHDALPPALGGALNPLAGDDAD